jgi:DNA-binding cell septation regulator SpoVG
MTVNDVQIKFIKPKDGLIAFGSCVIDNALYLSSIGIHQILGENKYRLTYPTRKLIDQNFNIFHPLNKETSSLIEEAILCKFKEVMKKVYENEKPI